MKKALTLFMALTALAVAADGGLAAKKPKPSEAAPQSTAAATCKAPRAAILFGTFVAGGESSFTMDVAKTNAHPRALAGKKGLEVGLSEKTRLMRRGASAKLSDFKAGDRLNVQAVLCNGTDAAAAKLVARRVVAKPAKAASDEAATTAAGTGSSG